MDPQNSGSDCILGRNLKVLLRQSFNSLLQVSVAACNSLSQQYLFLQHIYSITTKFPLSRQIFLWLFNTLSCKVYHSIHSMSQQLIHGLVGLSGINKIYAYFLLLS